MANRVAIIVCSGQSDTKLLGLSLGVPVLSALFCGGIDRVLFLGAGVRPTCARAELAIVHRAEILCICFVR